MTYRGVQYDGNHDPLVDAVTWQAVQDVLDNHLLGEKQRVYRHYLESTVWCGRCGSRLIVSVARNRHCSVCPYFVCLGRQKKHIRCTRRAVLISKVEEWVEDLWARTELPAEARDGIEAALETELAAARQAADLQRKQLTSEKTKLTNRRKRLMEAIYAGAVPLEDIAEEQRTLSTQLAAVDAGLAGAEAEHATIVDNLTKALDLATNCSTAYQAASDDVRRLFNQAFFEKLYIDDDGVTGELIEPFATIQSISRQVLGNERPPRRKKRPGVDPTESSRPFRVCSVLKRSVWCPRQESNPRPVG